MMESIEQASPDVSQEISVPRLSFFDWLAGTFVLAAFSPTFYYVAGRDRIIKPLLSFGTFLSVVVIVLSLSVVNTMRSITPEIRKAYEQNDVPEIVITDGIAEVEGPQPNVLMEEQGMIVVLDTTGEIRTIDRDRYEQGFLLTETEMIVLQDTGEIQRIPLDQLQAFVGENPWVLNGETVPRYWDTISNWLGVGSFVVLGIWHIVFRLGAIVTFALIFWGTASLRRPGSKLNPILASGLYAVVPALYIRFLLSLVNIQFPGLAVLVHLPLWGLGFLAAILPRRTDVPHTIGKYFASLHPLRSWRALIALPLLIYLIVMQFIVPRPEWYIAWGIAFATVIALFVVSLLPLLSLRRPQPLEPPATALG